jgi:hypothetical protein
MTTAIGYATKSDLGRILALQYIAYRSEAAPPAKRRFELFTGHRSEKNLRLYARLGYNEFQRKMTLLI